jgi:hypothetical protein
MEEIMLKFKLDPCYPTDTEMARAIKRLLEPYENTDEVIDKVYIADSMLDAKLDGLNPARNGYEELATGEIVWINL